MKIAMVSMNAGPLAWLGDADGGGQSVVVDCLSAALARLGHCVTIYTQRDDRTLPRCMTTAAGVHVDHIDVDDPAGAAAGSVLDATIGAFAGALAHEWSADPPDIVHAHAWTSARAAVDAARGYGCPVITTFHGVEAAKPPRRPGGHAAVRAATEAALIRDSVRLIATSSAEVFALLRMGANPGAIKLIPCGVDLALFLPRTRPQRAAGEPFRIATLGRLVADAGVRDVIEALAYVPGVELTVGGGRGNASDVQLDPDARDLLALAAARGVTDRVALNGRVRRDDVAPFLRAADAIVCAPHHDSTGTAALEAMACGVPVIVSAVGALVDVVADGMTGLHVPPCAPRQLGYAIAALESDPVRCERFGRFGVERASARYGWTRIAAETLDVYNSVAGHARATRMRG